MVRAAVVFCDHADELANLLELVASDPDVEIVAVKNRCHAARRKKRVLRFAAVEL